MQVRRCAIVFIEPREEVGFDLNDLITGGDGLRRGLRWFALAPHRGEEVEIDAEGRELLGRIGTLQWIDADSLGAHAAAAVQVLLRDGLLIAARQQDEDPQWTHWRQRDEALRERHWHPLTAAAHAFTRWRDVDAVQNMETSRTTTAHDMRETLGMPPTECVRRGDPARQIALPRAQRTQFDDLLARRATCRNWDTGRALPQALFAQMLERVFSAQSEVRTCEDMAFYKKTSPSGGGLHPIEAYLIVRNVEGVAPGLYHYQARDHALEPMPAPEGDLHEWTLRAVARQHWFADAHTLVLLSPRFDRMFWKYRQHAKGYRVVTLEAGHFSQTLYLSATDLGLGAFITGGINDVVLEEAFRLDPVGQGTLALCGFGWRGEEMVTAELDPAGEVWRLPADADTGRC
ncbi:putative peptide maturation dehydrogenase [Agrilutibacter solisilvae]|uniref:Peptide maturation dehydrogenase n=1 Tax=Agrilutibacter solisilvae TaxID=2763317 RepID=A0A974Y5U7_9GAMM|nr:putative peptide maturation dehydrogenase [Lysobacter solisilvae]QSX79036.1 putative peptide maturation dehydrogenase [Lysobacter solisilvae]